jgi:hypothetical protein
MKNRNIFKKIPQWFKKIFNNIRAVGILQWFKKLLNSIRAVGIWNWIGLASLAVGIFGVYYSYRLSQTTDATIKIVTWRGETPTDFVKEQIYQSKITITILGNKYMPTIDGEIKVPYNKYRNKEVEVGFESDNDILYIKDNKIILTDTAKLKVFIKGLDKISGNIKDYDTEQNIEGALIKVGEKEIYSDSSGNFKMEFQLNEQKVFQRIEITKTGYEDWICDKNMSDTAKKANIIDMRTNNRYHRIPVRLHRLENTAK